MAVSSNPNIVSYLCDAAIAKGKAVKIGTDRSHVAVGAANTDKVIGILQTATTAAEETAEVAIAGGGAKALLGEGVTAGAYLVSHTNGTLVLANAAGDHVVAVAMEAGDASDLIEVFVTYFEAYNAE
jgi:hypothetical protein